MAPIINWLMRQRLKPAKSGFTVDKRLAPLRQIQRRYINIDAASSISGISTVNGHHSNTIATLNPKKPTQ